MLNHCFGKPQGLLLPYLSSKCLCNCGHILWKLKYSVVSHMHEHRLYLTLIVHVCVNIYALSQAGSTCSTINHNFLAVFISDRKKVSLSFTFPSEKPNKKLFLSNVARRVPLTYKKKTETRVCVRGLS